MIKKILVIPFVNNLFYLFDKIVYNKWENRKSKSLYVIKDNSEYKLFEGNVYSVKSLKKNALIQIEADSIDGLLIDSELRIIEKFNGSVYIFGANVLTNFLQLEILQQENWYSYRVNSQFELTVSKRLYFLETKYSFISQPKRKRVIESFSKENENLLWQIDVSEYGVYKEEVDGGFEEHANSIDGELLADTDTIYVPMKGGQLLALNANDGSLEWMLDMPYHGFYTMFNNRIYKLSDWHIYEIDAHTGRILNSKRDKDILGNVERAYFTQGFKVYEDYLVLKNQLTAFVALINRRTFELEGYVEIPEGIGSSSDNLHWHKGKLYVLDMNNTLHIFEKE